jgi:hypothetical protein
VKNGAAWKSSAGLEMEKVPDAKTPPSLSMALPMWRGFHGHFNFGALTGSRVQSYSYVMRYSLEHKAQNHEKILSVAARSFRERGGDTSGIGTVMKKVGLKKGGLLPAF